MGVRGDLSKERSTEMIRKLNTMTAILLVTCLVLAPSALATDGPGSAWYTELIEIVTEWVVGGDDDADEPPAEAEEPKYDPPMLECEPGGEMGPVIDPNGPGC